MQKIKNYFNGSPMAGLSAGDYGIEPAVDCAAVDGLVSFARIRSFRMRKNSFILKNDSFMPKVLFSASCLFRVFRV